MTDNEYIRTLLKRYLAGQCTDAEQKVIEQWYDAMDKQQDSDTLQQEMGEDLSHIGTHIGVYRRRTSRWWYYATAAALLIAIGITVKFLTTTAQSPTTFATALDASNIQPGSDKATLTLPDGRIIPLDELNIGTFGHEGTNQLVKNEEGSLVYEHTQGAADASSDADYHTLNIPKGGQHRLTLPDGSRVWINSASSLTFAASGFEHNRTVQLTGEAYFEVAHNPAEPFRVVTGQQTVTVLGTKFNINSYADEPGTKTTLVEGSVDVATNGFTHPIRLIPGQESFVDGSGDPTVTQVETSRATAWINGLFRFDGNTIDEVMRQLSRWYDVDVVFEGNLPDDKLYGEVNRNTTANTPLELLSFFNFKHSVSMVNARTRITITNN